MRKFRLLGFFFVCLSMFGLPAVATMNDDVADKQTLTRRGWELPQWVGCRLLLSRVEWRVIRTAWIVGIRTRFSP